MTKRSIFYIIGFFLIPVLFSPGVANAQVKTKVIKYQELDTLNNPNITVVRHGNGRLFEIRLIQDSTQPHHNSMKLMGAKTTYQLEDKIQLTLEDIQKAQCVEYSSQQPPTHTIVLKCTKAGSAKLAAFTGANLRKQIGIIIDNELIAAPHITGKITGGSFEILFPRSLEEAKRLVQAINDAKREAMK